MATVLTGRIRLRLPLAPLLVSAALFAAPGGSAQPAPREPPPREPSLTVMVAPPVDAGGRPWKLALWASRPEPRVAATRTLSDDGQAVVSGLPAGPYQIEVFDQSGTRWLKHAVDLPRASDPLRLRIPKVLVTGRLSRGAKRVSASLLFAGPEDSRVWMESSAGGLFRGELPVLEEGEWDLEVLGRRPALRRHLEGVLPSGAQKDGGVWLELALGDTGVIGGVISESGQPQADVLVRGEAASGGASTQTLTDRDGGFDLGALDPGSYRVWAESRDGYSEVHELEIDQGSQPELQLALKPRRRFAGRVVADSGPVAGASVQTWLSSGVSRGDMIVAQDGRFQDDLPSDDGEVGVTVIAPGYAITMTRLWTHGQEPVDIAVSWEAGELIVEAPADALAAPDGRTIVLSHDGSMELVDYLGQWGTIKEPASGRRRVTIPGMAPGPYTACLVAASERAAVWLGAVPADRCASGTLAAGDRLALVLGRSSDSQVSR